MTNRRGFFRSLAALVGAASVSPTIFLPKFEPVKWKRGPEPFPFNPNDFYGVWQFVNYKQTPEGVWVEDSDGKIPLSTGFKRMDIKLGHITFNDVQVLEKANQV